MCRRSAQDNPLDRQMVTASTEFLLRSSSTSTGADSMSPGPGLYILPEAMPIELGDMIPEPPHRLERSYMEHIKEEDANDFVAAKVWYQHSVAAAGTKYCSHPFGSSQQLDPRQRRSTDDAEPQVTMGSAEGLAQTRPTVYGMRIPRPLV